MREFDRVCCVCSNLFITHNIYTVCCSPKCSRKGADTGLAKAAKAVLKMSYKLKKKKLKEDRQLKKAAYLNSLWGDERIVSHCNSHWGDEYEVDASKYSDGGVFISIRCNIHGDKSIRFKPESMQKVPCNECRVNHNKLTVDQFYTKCIEIHGDKFDYNYEYEGVDKSITFKCPSHGCQSMQAKAHLRSPTGCAKCSIESMDFARNPFGGINKKTVDRNPDEIIELYIISHSTGYKVGLSRNIKSRLKALGKHLSNIEILYSKSGRIQDMFKAEQDILSMCERDFNVGVFGGHTECVKENPLDIEEVCYVLV